MHEESAFRRLVKAVLRFKNFGLEENSMNEEAKKRKKEGWIDGRQDGQHNSRVWLKFSPKIQENMDEATTQKLPSFSRLLILSDLQATYVANFSGVRKIITPG